MTTSTGVNKTATTATTTTTTAAVVAAPSLNVYKKVAVIRRPSDSLTYEDNEGKQKSVSIQELGDAISNATPVSQTSTINKKLDIPVPRINNVDGYYENNISKNYKIPISYVKYHRLTDNEWKNYILDYIYDIEDEIWLKNYIYNNTNTNNSNLYNKQILPIHIFQYMMDLLEKETGFDIIITTQQAEILFHNKLQQQLYNIFPSSTQETITTTNNTNNNNNNTDSTTTTTKTLIKPITVQTVINDVYQYWLYKRSKLKRPLLRRYWPVTSTDDTNPHLVFRPREKEKYKLRKKRINDINSYKKLKQLRNDFNNLRLILDLVRKREHVYYMHVKIQIDLYKQRLYDAINTSIKIRKSKLINKDDYIQVMNVPIHFDIQFGGKSRINNNNNNNTSSNINDSNTLLTQNNSQHHSDQMVAAATAAATAALTGTTTTASITPSTLINIAGRNSGEPAPNFLHPLNTRESYITSWERAVPHINTYNEHAKSNPTFRFKHRPRIGRGGRVCIDRIPTTININNNNKELKPITVYTAGLGLTQSTGGGGGGGGGGGKAAASTTEHTLLDLLPNPLDRSALTRRIEGMSVAAIKEDYDARINADNNNNNNENDGDEIIVNLDDWLETDDQLWGEERYAIGPI